MIYLKGSPEWFYKKSQDDWVAPAMNQLEERRESFIEKYSPHMIEKMNSQEVLKNVFRDNPSSMLRLLMFDGNYREFGAAGTYKYLGIIYQDKTIWIA